MFDKDLISLYNLSSVVGARRNSRVESKLEKTNVTKYELSIYHWLGNLIQNNFYKRDVC